MGHFAIYRKVTGFDPSPLGTLFDPMYFTGGYAIHGNPSVPPYPASHGCVRVCRCGSRRTSTRRVRTGRRWTSISLALFALAGCGSSIGKPIAYTDITSELPGFQPPRLVREAFKTQAAFTKYVRHESPGIGRLPSIDWAHREAILVSAGPRSSTGYVLEIVSVRETAHHVVVTVHEKTPTLGEPVQARVTYPYRLITIAPTSKPLFLHWPGRP